MDLHAANFVVRVSPYLSHRGCWVRPQSTQQTLEG